MERCCRCDWAKQSFEVATRNTRVELLLGVLVDISPQGPLHAEVVSRLAEALIRELPSHVRTRVQSPLALSDDSEPEPDLAVVPAATIGPHIPSKRCS